MAHESTPLLSKSARKTYEGLQKSLPPTEWRAVQLWLNTFFRYQLEWLLDWERFALLLKARQIGASHTYGAAAVLWGLLGETTTAVSIGEREATEVLEKAKRHAAVLRGLGSRWAESRASNTEELALASGGRIVALPSTTAGRSYSGNVLLDEFAYHVRPERVWDGASAVVMHGYRLRVMSTPNGKGNLFHALWSNPVAHKGYTLHSVTLEDAKRDGLTVNDDDCWRMARGSRRVYDQLFSCSFDDVEGALWTQEMIDRARVESAPSDIVRTVVAIDPAVTSNETSDETGIVVAAMTRDRQFYVLADGSGKMTPLQWARRAVELYNDYRCDRIVAEENNGGALVEANLRTILNDVPYQGVRASAGKRARAEPIASLYERGRVHHVGRLPKLEEQLCSWDPQSGLRSPDRLDALVWAVSSLGFSPTRRSNAADALDLSRYN